MPAVLIAEDNMINQQMLKAMLDHEPLELVFANNGQQAIDAIAQQDFDLVLMDVRMPVMDGLAATRHIRSMDNPKANVPIIALTADATAEVRQACEDVGISDYMTKPLDLMKLQELVHHYTGITSP
ncbi:MAG: hypothetical protein Alpg2KO_25840 [Alphaproteobacteria bacterium]